MAHIGRVHSIQSLGTVDGPGIRFVVFLQGCPLRCGCCHNPDTWEPTSGTPYTAEQLVSTAERYREYFGDEGGITLTGGEPLLQAAFAREVLEECHRRDIHTCLDTSGYLLNDEVKAVLRSTDRVLLDIKYTRDELYRQHVGCGLEAPLRFLDYVASQDIPITLRQVIIPTLNDNPENVAALREICQKYRCIDKVELLPFRKLCIEKYQQMGIPFPFEHIPTPDDTTMQTMQEALRVT